MFRAIDFLVDLLVNEALVAHNLPERGRRGGRSAAGTAGCAAAVPTAPAAPALPALPARSACSARRACQSGSCCCVALRAVRLQDETESCDIDATEDKAGMILRYNKCLHTTQNQVPSFDRFRISNLRHSRILPNIQEILGLFPF